MIDFTKFEGYVPFNEPILFHREYEAIGYFPYSVAAIHSTMDQVRPSRHLFAGVEEMLRRHGISDNKFVVIFRDLVNFGTDDFAIYFKDAYCKIGNWEDVIGYGGKPLKLVEQGQAIGTHS